MHFPPAFQPIEPLERAQTLPSKHYTCTEHYEKVEKPALFDRAWQWVGHRSELQHNGDYLTAKIGEDPIVVVLENNQLHGFYNVCKHRGGPLVKNNEKSASLKYGAFVCQYHGWTYRLNGQLRGVPSFDRAELFDKADFGLMPVEIAEWQGLIFAKRADKPAICSIDALLHGIDSRMEGIRLQEYRFHQRVSYDIACNWKVYVDNFLEGYHIPIVHPELARLVDYKRYVTEIEGWHSLQHAPFRPGENVYQSEDGAAWYWFVFPNIMLNVLPGRMQTNVVEPLGAQHCRVHFDYYYTDIEKAVSSGLVKDDLAYSEEIQQEDIEICEEVQRGLRSPAYDRGRFSPDRESGVWHFQQLYQAVIANK